MKSVVVLILFFYHFKGKEQMICTPNVRELLTNKEKIEDLKNHMRKNGETPTTREVFSWFENIAKIYIR